MAKNLSGSISIAFVMLNLAVVIVIITQLSGMLALASVLFLVMLALIVSRIEMKSIILKEHLRRRKMQDVLYHRLDNISSAVEDASIAFRTKTDEMYNKLHSNIDMQRRVWTHDFEIKHRSLKNRVEKIEEKVAKLQRISEI